MQEICIVVPCFNEALRLKPELFSSFIKDNSYFFLFVDDGSTDGTKQILDNLKRNFPENINILSISNNVGKAEAVRQGIIKSLNDNRFEHIGFIDADLATPLEELNYLAENFSDGYKMILGSRVKRLGTTIKRNLSRHYMGRIFATLASYILKVKVYDSQCGAKLFEKELALKLFSTPFVSKWLFDLELIYRLKNQLPEEFNNSIIEIPLRRWEEKEGSKLQVIDLVNAPLDLLKIKFYSLKEKKV